MDDRRVGILFNNYVYKTYSTMMKKRLLLILLPFLLFACEEEKTFLFDEEPGIYFSKENINLEYDFAFGKGEGLDEWGNPTIVFVGDSLQTDTISFVVYRSGKLVENINFFNLKLVDIERDEDEADLEPFEVEFFNPYKFAEGKDKVRVRAVLHRPDSRGLFESVISFELAGSDTSFVNTINEFSHYTIEASDRYLRPRGWVDDTSAFGPYSEEKYAFYVTVLGMVYEDWHEFYADFMFLPKLRDALSLYNSTHDVPKDFTF